MRIIWFDDQGESYISDTVTGLMERGFDIDILTTKASLIDMLEGEQKNADIVAIFLDWRIDDETDPKGFHTTFEVFVSIMDGAYGDRFRSEIPVVFVTQYWRDIAPAAEARGITCGADKIIEKGDPRLVELLLDLLRPWL